MSAGQIRSEIERLTPRAETGEQHAHLCFLYVQLERAEQSRRFACTYCGAEKPSENGTGSDVECCGERGHVEEAS